MKKKLTREANNAKLGTVIIVLAMVIIFAGVFVWMYRVDMLFLPDFIEDIIGKTEGGEIVWDMGELSEIVKNGKNDDSGSVTFELTYENLRAAFLSETPPEGIYICADVSYYDDGEPSVHRVKYFRNGGFYRSEIYFPGGSDSVETLKIADTVNVTVIDETTGEMYTFPRASGITPENETGIPSVEALMAAVEAFPELASDSADSGINETNEATASEVSSCEIRMVETEHGNVYYISFVYAELGIREEYFVSLSYGTVISADTYSDGVPVYSYDTVTVSTDREMYSDSSLYMVSKADK